MVILATTMVLEWGYKGVNRINSRKFFYHDLDVIILEWPYVRLVNYYNVSRYVCLFGWPTVAGAGRFPTTTYNNSPAWAVFVQL